MQSALRQSEANQNRKQKTNVQIRYAVDTFELQYVVNYSNVLYHAIVVYVNTANISSSLGTQRRALSKKVTSPPNKTTKLILESVVKVSMFEFIRVLVCNLDQRQALMFRQNG